MARLYFHIGIPKTGTTALQHFLTMNEDTLLDTRILYLKTGRTLYPFAHSDFFFAVRNQEHRGQKAQDLGSLVHGIKAEVRDSAVDRVILSCENFASLRDFEEIRAAFGDFDVKVVVYLRKQDEWLYALYAHRVLYKGYAKEPYDLFDDLNHLICYDALLERWGNAFGFSNLKVSLFGDEVKRVGIARHFLDKIGVPWRDDFALPPINKSNITPSHGDIYSVRVKNMNVGGDGSDQQASDTLLSKEAFLRDERTLSFMKCFAASNRDVARRYFGRDGDLF